MNLLCHELIPVDEKKWNDVLVFFDVQGKILGWRISKLVVE